MLTKEEKRIIGVTDSHEHQLKKTRRTMGNIKVDVIAASAAFRAQTIKEQADFFRLVGKVMGEI